MEEEGKDSKINNLYLFFHGGIAGFSRDRNTGGYGFTYPIMQFPSFETVSLYGTKSYIEFGELLKPFLADDAKIHFLACSFGRGMFFDDGDQSPHALIGIWAGIDSNVSLIGYNVKITINKNGNVAVGGLNKNVDAEDGYKYIRKRYLDFAKKVIYTNGGAQYKSPQKKIIRESGKDYVIDDKKTYWNY